jgi:CBS domain-containing protein
MSHSFKLSRRIARFRALGAVALLLGLAACDDSLNPDRSTTADPIDQVPVAGDDGSVAMVTPEAPLEEAASILLAQEHVPVIDHGTPVGVITRGDVATALAHAGPNTTVAEAPHHEVVTVAPADPLDSVLDRLRGDPDTVAVVIDQGEPVGLLTANALAAYVAMHEKRAA